MVRRLQIVVAIFSLLPLVSLAAVATAAQTPLLITQTPTVISGAGDTIGIVLPVTNSGAVQASGVKITSIQMSAAQLLTPSNLPISLGNIPTKETFQIEASFNGSHLTVGGRYLLTVRGTYETGSTTSGFSLNRFVTIPTPAQLQIGINKTDDLLLQIQAASGDSIDYFGTKDSNGLATNLKTVLLKAKSGGTSRFDVDSQGRPLRISGSDGTTFTFAWISASSAEVTAMSADGSKKATVSVNTSQTRIAKQHSSGTLSLAGESSTFQKPPTASAPSPGVLPVRLSWKAGPGKGPFASADYCDPTPQVTGAGAVVTIHVDHCGPVDDANVTLAYNPGGAANLVTFPGTDVPGTGDYNVNVPTPGAEVSSVGEACNSLADALGNACEAAVIMPFVCTALANPVTGIVTAVFVPECLALSFEAIEYCEVLGGGLPEGSPSLFEGFCSVVTKTIDLAARTTVQLQAVVDEVGLGTQAPPPVEVEASNPSHTFNVLFPCFSLDGEWIGTAIFNESGGSSETDSVSATFTSSTVLAGASVFTVDATVVFTEEGGVPETHTITYKVTGSTVTLSGDITMTGTITAVHTGQVVSGMGFDAAEGANGTGNLTFSNGGLTMQGNITSGSDLQPGSGTLTVSADRTHMTGTATDTDGSTVTWTAVKQ